VTFLVTAGFDSGSALTVVATAEFDSGVYGALANVAAITTALQSVVALLALQRGMEIGSRAAVPLTAEYNAAKKAASRNFWGLGVLNLVALSVTVVVLAAWFKIGVWAVYRQQWELWAPCVAVAFGCLLLTGTAAVGLTKLCRVARRP
jgi:hypothetical protein